MTDFLITGIPDELWKEFKDSLPRSTGSINNNLINMIEGFTIYNKIGKHLSYKAEVKEK